MTLSKVSSYKDIVQRIRQTKLIVPVSIAKLGIN